VTPAIWRHNFSRKMNYLQIQLEQVSPMKLKGGPFHKNRNFCHWIEIQGEELSGDSGKKLLRSKYRKLWKNSKDHHLQTTPFSQATDRIILAIENQNLAIIFPEEKTSGPCPATIHSW